MGVLEVLGFLKDGEKNEFESLRKSTAGSDHYEAFFKQEGRSGKWSINKPENIKKILSKLQ